MPILPVVLPGKTTNHAAKPCHISPILRVLRASVLKFPVPPGMIMVWAVPNGRSTNPSFWWKMSSGRNPDPFESSTMTFGQHLQELRVCLFKAAMGLALGIIVGLLIGGEVVSFIKLPLEKALGTYVQKQAVNRATGRIEEMRKAGVPLPDDNEKLVKLLSEQQLLPQEIYLDPNDLLRQLKPHYPNLEKVEPAKPAEGADTSQMVRMFVYRPLADDVSTHVKSFNVYESFGIYLKASMIAGIVLSSPWIFYQLWTFVAAGLYPHERWYVHVFLPFSVFLFLAGASMAFFFVFQPVLKFLFYFNSSMGIDPDPRISEWLGFVLMLPLGFGAAFQLPLVMLFLERIGILTTAVYWSHWRTAVLAIAVLAMLLTPEPTSMMMMVGPLTLLYFGGILLCYFMPTKRRPAGLDD